MSDAKNYFVGQTVRGTVTGVNNNAIYLEIEEGVKAVIYAKDMKERPTSALYEEYCEGNEYSAQVKSIGKDNKNTDVVLLTLSTRLDLDEEERIAREKALEDKMVAMQELKDADEVFTAKIVKVVKGGAELSYKQTRLFLPFSQSLLSEDELKKSKGKDCEVLITYINAENHFISVSALAASRKEKRLAKEAAFNAVEVGQVLDGEVVQLLQYGAIVSLGLVRGLLHISEIDHFPVYKIENALKVGQKVKVKVIKVNGEHIGLSIKALTTHPWELLKEKYHVDDVFDGKVLKIIPAGLIIYLTDKYSGLMPRAEYSWLFTEHYDNVIKEGDTISVKVINIDDEKKRVSLSHKVLTENKWGNLDIKKGDIINVVVASMLQKGANVTYNGVVGFLPLSEVAAKKRVSMVGEAHPIGKEVKVRVQDFDPRRARLVVSARAALEPVKEVVKKVDDEPKFVAEEGEKDTLSLGDLIDLDK